jgi:hypothetical protein
MKKTFLVAFLLMFGLVIQAQAVSTNSNQGNKSGQTDIANATAVDTVVNGNQSENTNQNQEKNKVMNQGENTQIQTKEVNMVENGDNVKDKQKDSANANTTAEKHRSAIANFTQSLLSVADRESGIGSQVRIIANQQNETKDRAADLIFAVENRNKLKTFFIGTSYKNIGELRSQMTQTKSQIEQLKQLAEKAENEGDKIELQNQIQVLEQEQTNISNFIAQNESNFSLFGWAVKLFRK